MAEAPDATVTLGEGFYKFEDRLLHGNDDELRDTLTRLDSECRRTAVPARDQQLPLIVRVDEPDEITEHDAVLMAEPGTWEYQRGQTRIGKMNRKTCMYEFTVSGGKFQRLV